MIISYKNKFIFIHCRKVAGSAITTYLNQFIGPDDIQVGVWGDTILNGGTYNRRFYYDLLTSRRSLKGLAKSLLRTRSLHPERLNEIHKRKYRQFFGSDAGHPTASEIRQFDEYAWNNFFKFCFVRNPYDRIVSDYLFLTRIKKVSVSFCEFLERASDASRHDPEKVLPENIDNWPMYTIDDNIVVDFIGKFENLDEDFKQVCSNLNVPYIDKSLPIVKQVTSPSRSYRSWYTHHEKSLVESLFCREIESFGYRF